MLLELSIILFIYRLINSLIYNNFEYLFKTAFN